MTDQAKIIGYIAHPEQEVLGCLLFGGDFRKVMSFLKVEHFIPDVHKILFSAIKTAYEQYGSTAFSVVAKLLQDDDIDWREKTGKTSSAYMASLSEASVYGNAGIERAGRAVVEQWARIKSGEIAKTLHDASTDPTADVGKLLRSVSAEFDMITSEMRAGPRRKTRVTLAAAAESAFAAADDARLRGSGLTGITWGLTDVNAATGGIQRRDLTLLAGRPGMGKTTVALSALISRLRFWCNDLILR